MLTLYLFLLTRKKPLDLDSFGNSITAARAET